MIDSQSPILPPTSISSGRRLYTGMITFFEYIAQNRRTMLPDTLTMLSMAGVGLDSPNEEETKRLLNRDRKRQPAGGKARRSIISLDSQPTVTAGKRI